MNHQTWSKRKFWASLIGAFFLGSVITASGSEAPQTSNAGFPSPTPITRQVKVEDTERLRKLDTLDREIFALSAEVVNAQTTALQEAAAIFHQYPNFDPDRITQASETIGKQTRIIEAATDKIEAKQSERNRLLSR